MANAGNGAIAIDEDAVPFVLPHPNDPYPYGQIVKFWSRVHKAQRETKQNDLAAIDAPSTAYSRSADTPLFIHDPKAAKLRELDREAKKSLVEKREHCIIPDSEALPALDLSRFYSRLPPDIGALSALQSLILSNNDLYTGSFPKHFANLTSLRDLDLSDNYHLEHLPSTITSFSSLTRLKLHFTGLREIPVDLVHATPNMVDLWIHNNELRGSLHPEVGLGWNSLKFLQLRLNSLDTLVPSIEGWRSMVQLEVSNNRLTSFPSVAPMASTLELLDIRFNRLTAPPPDLHTLTKLTTLFLSNNRLESLPTALGNMTALESLFLQRNHISELPVSIGNLKHLAQLNISDNEVAALPRSMAKMRALNILSAEGNLLTSLPSEIWTMFKLRKTLIKRNPCTLAPSWLSADVGPTPSWNDSDLLARSRGDVEDTDPESRASWAWDEVHEAKEGPAPWLDAQGMEVSFGGPEGLTWLDSRKLEGPMHAEAQERIKSMPMALPKRRHRVPSLLAMTAKFIWDENLIKAAKSQLPAELIEYLEHRREKCGAKCSGSMYEPAAVDVAIIPSYLNYSELPFVFRLCSHTCDTVPREPSFL